MGFCVSFLTATRWPTSSCATPSRGIPQVLYIECQILPHVTRRSERCDARARWAQGRAASCPGRCTHVDRRPGAQRTIRKKEERFVRRVRRVQIGECAYLLIVPSFKTRRYRFLFCCTCRIKRRASSTRPRVTTMCNAVLPSRLRACLISALSLSSSSSSS